MTTTCPRQSLLRIIRLVFHMSELAYSCRYIYNKLLHQVCKNQRHVYSPVEALDKMGSGTKVIQVHALLVIVYPTVSLWNWGLEPSLSKYMHYGVIVYPTVSLWNNDCKKFTQPNEVEVHKWHARLMVLAKHHGESCIP
jgi:hypothetical protein